MKRKKTAAKKLLHANLLMMVNTHYNIFFTTQDVLLLMCQQQVSLCRLHHPLLCAHRLKQKLLQVCTYSINIILYKLYIQCESYTFSLTYDSSLDKSSFVLGNELWEEHFESLLALVKAYIIDIWEERKSKLYGDVECAQQPRPHSPTGDLGEIAVVNGQNSEGMCQGGKPGTGKLYTVCCSAHTSGCVVDGLGATAAF